MPGPTDHPEAGAEDLMARLKESVREAREASRRRASGKTSGLPKIEPGGDLERILRQAVTLPDDTPPATYAELSAAMEGGTVRSESPDPEGDTWAKVRQLRRHIDALGGTAPAHPPLPRCAGALQAHPRDVPATWRIERLDGPTDACDGCLRLYVAESIGQPIGQRGEFVAVPIATVEAV
jgi:hypothetical protein